MVNSGFANRTPKDGILGVDEEHTGAINTGDAYRIKEQLPTNSMRTPISEHTKFGYSTVLSPANSDCVIAEEYQAG